MTQQALDLARDLYAWCKAHPMTCCVFGAGLALGLMMGVR